MNSDEDEKAHDTIYNAYCDKQLQLDTRVCTAAFWLVDLKLQQLTKLEVIETEWPMQVYRFIFHALLLQKNCIS